MSASIIPLCVPNIGELEREYLNECVDSKFVSTVGPFVDRFEESVAALSGSSKGVATSAGTTALHVALVAVGVQPGNLVICPDYTFIASVNAVRHQYAEPWLFDICEENWTIDVDQMEEALEQNTSRSGEDLFHKITGQRIACIMPVYTLGSVANMQRINELAQRFSLPVVADAAAAIGARYNGEVLGNLADLTCFSFNGNKTITSGGGGMVIGRDSRLLDRVRHLTTTARSTANYDYDEVGYNYRMTNLQAAVGCAQLERLDSFVETKKSISANYDAAFKDLSSVESFPDADWSESVKWFSGILLSKNSTLCADQIIKLLNEEGIMARAFWKPIHRQAPYESSVMESLRLSESIWDKIVTLPCSTGLSSEDQSKCIESVRSIFMGHS